MTAAPVTRTRRCTKRRPAYVNGMPPPFTLREWRGRLPLARQSWFHGSMADAAKSGQGADGAGRLPRTLVVAVVAGVFLAVSGAFGTAGMPLAVRLAYWIILLLLGSLWALWVARRVFAWFAGDAGPWRGILVTSLAVAAPFTGVVWLANLLATSMFAGVGATAGLFLVSLIISAVVTTINVLLTRGAAPAPGAAATAPPRFLERLPLKLRGAELWAVESEDHYLRLHTSRGQDLILMRLADAMSELEGIEGAQVHRSWWVSRKAIMAARRGDGRATLTLPDGAEVPVSRTYAKALRERSWI
jgi:DNA-binding LytR/AlgR family response regulator